jgi:hypothetical protein
MLTYCRLRRISSFFQGEVHGKLLLFGKSGTQTLPSSRQGLTLAKKNRGEVMWPSSPPFFWLRTLLQTLPLHRLTLESKNFTLSTYALMSG